MFLILRTIIWTLELLMAKVQYDIHADAVPLDCPVCELTMRDAEDANCFRMFACCSECRVVWVDSNRARWMAGWRPDIENLNIYRHKLSLQPTYLLRL
jgi:hypothetical protein